MEDSKRLELLVEVVKYCQKVKAMGMPSSCYTKALREPVHYLWERRAGTKIQAAEFRSNNSVGLSFGKRELVYDHAIPFSYLQNELLGLKNITKTTVRNKLNKFGTICLITKDEDETLSKAGLGRRMPENWDGEDRLARYRAVKIKTVKNKAV